MALQSSGAISLSDIKTELGSSANDFRTLHAAAGFSTPDSISEFYGYSAVTYTEFQVEVFGDFGILCSGEPGDLAVVYSRAYSTVVRGDTLYADTSGTLYNGGNNYHKNSSGNGHRVDARGLVGSEEVCG